MIAAMYTRKSTAERLVDLEVWWKDGALQRYPGRSRSKLPTVEVGRTDSRRGLGFVVETGERTGEGQHALFFLAREQVERLRDFLAYSVRG